MNDSIKNFQLFSLQEPCSDEYGHEEQHIFVSFQIQKTTIEKIEKLNSQYRGLYYQIIQKSNVHLTICKKQDCNQYEVSETNSDDSILASSYSYSNWQHSSQIPNIPPEIDIIKISCENENGSCIDISQDDLLKILNSIN